MPTAKRIRIMIVEDHPIFREGLNMIIEAQEDMEMVAQVSTAEEALQQYRRVKPDLVLIDQRLPGASGATPLSQFGMSSLTSGS